MGSWAWLVSNINGSCYVVLPSVVMVAGVAWFTGGGSELLLLALSSVVVVAMVAEEEWFMGWTDSG